ncbi:hypothetical protein NPIL_316211 [Nephila pilipes]|uniref:Uncharacterized protein n=1 Tax=Nephila pilipes TaxID=299642 RepID=A0A8X6NF82_NEPPI|nr:hypothetical protein NPIL_316211 [Nephila pilipes]
MDSLLATPHEIFPNTEVSVIFSVTLRNSDTKPLFVLSISQEKINVIDNLLKDYYASADLSPGTFENLRIIRQNLVAGDFNLKINHLKEENLSLKWSLAILQGSLQKRISDPTAQVHSNENIV